MVCRTLQHRYTAQKLTQLHNNPASNQDLIPENQTIPENTFPAVNNYTKSCQAHSGLTHFTYRTHAGCRKCLNLYVAQYITKEGVCAIATVHYKSRVKYMEHQRK